MKFLHIILIGSLSLSTVPSYGFSLSLTSAVSSVATWWKSQSNFQKGYLIGLCIYGAVVCYLIKKSSPSRIVTNILWAPMREDVQAQQEQEIKQLREIITSGYRLTTDPYMELGSLPIYIHSRYGSFLIKAINKKPYLIPLLKELGATPMLIEMRDGDDPLFYCFRIAAEQKTSRAFNTLLENYPLSDNQWGMLITYLSIVQDKNILSNIITHIPEKIINNIYNLVGFDCTLLWICAKAYIDFPERNSYVLPLMQQLLDRGADPLMPNNSNGQNILDLLLGDIDHSAEKNVARKQLRTLIEPYAKNKKDARIKAIADATCLSSSIDTIKLCSDYECDTTGNRLLDLITSDQEEEVIHKKLRSVIDNDTFGYNYILNRGDAHGKTPLMYAVDRGHLTVVQELMDLGADIEACSKDGSNVLMYAASKSNSHLVRTILENAKKSKKDISTLINKQDKVLGITPLMCAVVNNNEDAVHVLLEHGADTALQDTCNRDTAKEFASWIQDENSRKRILALLEHPPRPAAQPAPNMSLSLE